MNIKLRAIKQDDWILFKKWWHDKELIELTSGKSEFFSDEKLKKSISEILLDKESCHRIIEADDIPVGHINFDKISQNKAELQLVIGEKSFWRKGVGTAAVKQVFALAKILGFKELYLEARPENTGAIAFYTKLGFHKIGTKKYNSPHLPEVIQMNKKI